MTNYTIINGDDKIEHRLEHIKCELHYLDSEYCPLDDEEIATQQKALCKERGNIHTQTSHKSSGVPYEWTIPVHTGYCEPVGVAVDRVQMKASDRTPCRKYPSTGYVSMRKQAVADIRAKGLARGVILSNLVNAANKLKSGIQAVTDAIVSISYKHDDRLAAYARDVYDMIDLYHSIDNKNIYVTKSHIWVCVGNLSKRFKLRKSGYYSKPMIDWLEGIFDKRMTTTEINTHSGIFITSIEPTKPAFTKATPTKKPGKPKTAKTRKTRKVRGITKTPTPQPGKFAKRIAPLVKTW